MLTSIISGLRDVEAFMGVPGTLILFALLLSGLYLFTKLILEHGITLALKLYLPFILNLFKILKDELHKLDVLPIKIELLLTCFYGALLFLAWVADGLHHVLQILLPSTSEGLPLNQGLFVVALFSVLGLCAVSITLSLFIK
jgi:hypothetical protein